MVIFSDTGHHCSAPVASQDPSGLFAIQTSDPIVQPRMFQSSQILAMASRHGGAGIPAVATDCRGCYIDGSQQTMLACEFYNVSQSINVCSTSERRQDLRFAYAGWYAWPSLKCQLHATWYIYCHRPCGHRDS